MPSPLGALGNEKLQVALRVSARVSFEKRSIHRVQLDVLGTHDEIHAGQGRQLTELGVRERGLGRAASPQQRHLLDSAVTKSLEGVFGNVRPR